MEAQDGADANIATEHGCTDGSSSNSQCIQILSCVRGDVTANEKEKKDTKKEKYVRQKR